MEKETLKNIFKFLEDEGEHKAPLKWKLNNDIPLTKKELNFEGDLSFLAGSSIKSLPKGFKVYGHLYIQYTKITSLPEGLKVGGHLYIHSTPLAKLSDETILSMIEPDGYIKGEIIR
jgi:hypothetical protein